MCRRGCENAACIEPGAACGARVTDYFSGAQNTGRSTYSYTSTLIAGQNEAMSCVSARTFTGSDRIFSFVPPTTGTWTISTEATFDTVLEVRSDCLDSTSAVACNDDNGSLRTSSVSERLIANTTYYIVVEPFNANEREVNFTLNASWRR